MHLLNTTLKKLRIKLNLSRETFWDQYKHALPLLAYMIFYLSWWSMLEKAISIRSSIIDDENDATLSGYRTVLETFKRVYNL